jgi:hypothetical protein
MLSENCSVADTTIMKSALSAPLMNRFIPLMAECAVTDRSHPSATWVGTGIGVGARKAAFPFSAPTADTALALEIIARIPASV